MLKSFRYFLFPFALVYGGIVYLRNLLFDKGILKSAEFNFPVICIGNLAVGGTGKTPMTEFIITHLKDQFRIATLSRGYKRRTKGFAIANESSTAIEIGDEPMQFHKKFPDITVAVGEERIIAIPQILYQRPETEVILLDDAFQHRTVRAGLNILLTEYKNLFTRDIMFPAGDLRDVKSSSKRADIVVVTKCQSDLSHEEKTKLAAELNLLPHQQLFFTTIEYGEPYHLFSREQKLLDMELDVLLVCGIANPKSLKDRLLQNVKSYEMLKYPDHHIFSSEDLDDIKNQFSKMGSANKIILTTEKDAVRIEKFSTELKDYPLYVLPVKHKFLFNQESEFVGLLEKFISGFESQKQEN